nr:hypothetical protein [Pedobacter sp. ASV2]
MVIVEVLLPGVGSVIPVGGVKFTVLFIDPVADFDTVPTIVKIADCPFPKVKLVQFPFVLS